MEKGKIFPRRTPDDNPVRPYSIETDRPDYVREDDLGVIAILPVYCTKRWIFGLSAKGGPCPSFCSWSSGPSEGLNIPSLQSRTYVWTKPCKKHTGCI